MEQMGSQIEDASEHPIEVLLAVSGQAIAATVQQQLADHCSPFRVRQQLECQV